MEKNYVVTVTSGSYDDYEHGCLFAVKNEEQGLKIVDLLNAYSNFRSRWREEFWEVSEKHVVKIPIPGTGFAAVFDEDLNKADEIRRKLRDEYVCPLELKVIEEKLHSFYAFIGHKECPEFWPEDCVFALETLTVVEFEDGI